jgi:superfamily II DNA or RNA helicase
MDIWDKIDAAVEMMQKKRDKEIFKPKAKAVAKYDTKLIINISREETYIDAADISIETIQKIKGYFTIRDKTIMGYDKITHCFKLIGMNKSKRIIVPRFGSFLLSGKFKNIVYNCSIQPQNPIKTEYLGNPTFIQNLLLSDLECRFNEQKMKQGRAGVIINLQAGLGKTYLSLSLINKLQCRTLVITHNRTILKQWKDLLIKSFPKNVIGCYYGEERKDGDIVVGVINSLIMPEMPGYTSPREFYDRFDLLIFDECHEYCAPGRSKIFDICQAPYMVGLSATPEERSDNLSKIIKWNIGSILEADKLPGYTTEDIPFKGHVIQVKYYGPDEFTESIINQKLETISVPKMIQQFVADKQRTRLVAELTLEFYEKNYNIFVFADRRDYLLEIQAILEELKLKSNILTQDEDLSTIRLVGGSSDTEMNMAMSKQVILSTYQYMATGCSIPRMNCIILATPRKNKSRQTINRIFRLGSDYSIVRQIVDIVDWKTTLKNQYYERKKYYDSQNFTYEVRKVVAE